MTTTPVMITGGPVSAQGLKNTPVPEDTRSFSDVFNQSVADNAGQTISPKDVSYTAKANDAASTPKTEEREQIQIRQSSKPKNRTEKSSDDNTAKETMETSDEQLTPEEEEKAMQILAETAVTVVDRLADFFQMTPEEVNGAMEMLGMAETDLLDATSFQNLFATLAKDPEGSFLLTGDELTGSFEDLWSQVTQMLTQVEEENGWSGQQLQMLLDAQNGLSAESGVISMTDALSEEPIQEDNTSYTVTFMQDGKEVSYDVAKDSETGVATTEGITEVEIPQTPRTDNHQESGQHKENTDQTEKGAELIQEFQPGTGNISNEQMVSESVNSFSTVDTQDIMDQIMDYMKVENSETFTKLEMQLHPETMGKVVIEITSRNGELTAQITTQNEAVRAALESQLVSLKENLNEQGLRVENVQVTVETHSFEQGYEGQGKSENQEASSGQPKTHRIHLEDIDLEDEELTDEERMVAELMADRGGTLDYTV